MNKKLTIIALALTLPLTMAAYAGGKGPGHFGGPGDRVERLATRLDLTADQKTKLEEIFKREHEKFKAIHQETNQEIQGVLSADQMTKYEELQKQRMEKWHKRHEERKQQKSDESAD